jgi:hypothetical protein
MDSAVPLAMSQLTQIRSYGTPRSARRAQTTAVLYTCLALLAVVVAFVGTIWSVYD